MLLRKTTQQKPVIRSEHIIKNKNSIDIPKLIHHLINQALFHPMLVKDLINLCYNITNDQPNVIELEDPVTIIGDIHGQFFDLIKLLNYTDILSKQNNKNKIIFLGDYVDRGINSIQVMILLISLKIQYKERIVLLRGNHESKIMTEMYNFKTECVSKFSQQIYQIMLDFFNTLPIACIVNKAYFCVHGGISDKMIQVQKINSIYRQEEIPLNQVAYCDFVWSDPVQHEKGYLKTKSAYNKSRDCSIVYGYDLVKQFLKINELTTIIRGHQVFIEGYNIHNWSGIASNPPLITVFSAPNYCSGGNKGAILKIQQNSFKFKQIKEQHPQKHRFLTHFDIFTWTLPQIMINVKQIMQEMTKSIVDLRIPQLRSEPLQDQISILTRYARQTNKIQPIQPKKSVIPVMSEEQERQYLFNRSHDYYAESEKAPKHR